MKEKRNFDLLTLGQLLLRLSPPNNERLVRGDIFEKQVGGAELNVAVGVSLLGLHAGVISKLPAHDMGNFMKSKYAYLTIFCTTIPLLPGWGSITTKTAPIPESQR